MTKESIKLFILHFLSKLLKFRMVRGRITISEIIYNCLKPKTQIVKFQVGGLPIKIDLSQQELRYIYFSAYERNEVDFLLKWLKKGDICIDVGANVGFLSAIMAQAVGNEGKVYSFEPNPEIYNYLKDLEKHSSGVINVFPHALIDETNEKVKNITLYLNPRHSMWCSTIPEVNKSVSAKPIIVPAISLSKFILKNNISILNFVKIDVESGESKVLNGIIPFLKTGMRPTILCEISPKITSNWKATLMIVRNLVENYNYKMYTIKKGGSLEFMTLNMLTNYKKTLNVVFINQIENSKLVTNF